MNYLKTLSPTNALLIKIYALAAFSVLFTVSTFAQDKDLLINEIMASNTRTILSPEYGEYSDWIEIHNSGLTDINLSGFSLTDDKLNLQKWVIKGNCIIPAEGFLLFWADDYDNGIHTNFKLSKDGEFIALVDFTGEIIDSLTFPTQRDDISFGRIPGDNGRWNYLTNVTPMAENIFNEIKISADPQFYPEGGFYSKRVAVKITNPDSLAVIRFTLDGNSPDENSTLYTGPFIIDSTTSLRARAFSPGSVPSRIITSTYFIDEETRLPIISLTTDPANFFSDETGIYITGTNGRPGDCDPTVRNVNQDWERLVHLEFYETDRQKILDQDAGVKIFGGCSRTRYPQKSLALYARSEYGKGSFDCRFFPDKPIEKFESFLLRSSSDDQVFTMFRDALAHKVVGQDPQSDFMASRAALVFLNGQYFGIHNIREKVNEHYFKGNFNVNLEDLNILERNPYSSWNVIFGSNNSYNAMMDYIQTHNLASIDFYNYVQTQMDIDQYINYEIGHIYLAERDWPGNNIRFWKSNVGKYSKWRWINYDMDQTFMFTTENNMVTATSSNGPSWPNPPWSTLLLRKLLLNNNFKYKFIQRYMFLMNTIYDAANVVSIIDSFQANIEVEIPRHIEKWGGKVDPDFHEQGWRPQPTFNSVQEWKDNIEQMRVFARDRKMYALQHLREFYNLKDTAHIEVRSNNSEAGKLKMVDMELPKSGYSGSIIQIIPFRLEAIPAYKYQFDYWLVGTTKNYNRILDISISGDHKITAYFSEKKLNDDSMVIINEINYNSSVAFNPGDWIELYNRRNEPIDLSGWKLSDENENNVFTIPKGTEIGANDYLVLCSDSKKFQNLFPEVTNFIGDFDFGLSNDGELIRLYADQDYLVDSVLYSDKYPWPSDADGNDATLELQSTELDNDLPENWFCYFGKHGTPGRKNNTFTSSNEEKSENMEYGLLQNYPNPFNPVTTIKYSVPAVVNEAHFANETKTTLKVYDILGREIKVLVDEKQDAGIYEVKFDASTLASGVYFYSLKTGSNYEVRKMILMR